MIGKEISHYKILEELGRGGMGVVYKAQDTKLDRIVALKFLPAHLTTDHDAVDRFEREAKAAAALNHPHIVTIFEIAEHEGQTFISMEYVEGTSVRDLIEKGPLAVDQAVDIAAQVADGLSKAHQADIVHRDIKPENILLDPDGRVRILDFGLAKLRGVTRLTKEASTLGTVQYMSPEQARGEEVDHRTDIWSLGIVLFEMIAGQPPFRGDYEQAVTYSILNEDPTAITGVRSGVPLELERILGKCMEKDPTERYQTAEDLGADIRRLKRRESEVQAGTQPAVPRKGRSWLPWAIVGVVVLAVLAIQYVGSRRSSTERGLTGRRMIVVLPFENLGSPDDEYFANGITDAITARLAGVAGLGVISRQSAVRYKDTDKTVQQIGEELGVEYLLEGTVQRERPGDPASRVRVIPQLIRVSDDTHIWATTYDDDLTEVFRVQSDIAGHVATELNVALLGTEQEALRSRPTENLEAYEYFLRGNEHHGRRFLVEEVEAALAMYQKAVVLDSTFALAWAALGREYVWRWRFSENEEHKARATEYIDRALSLEPGLLDAHLARGHYFYYVEKNYDEALRHLGYVLDRRPSDDAALAMIGFVKRRQGRFEEAAEDLLRAAQMNPADYMINSDGVGGTLIFLRRFDEAERYLDRTISMSPHLPMAHVLKTAVYLCRDGDRAGARGVLEEALLRTNPRELLRTIFLTSTRMIMRALPDVTADIVERVRLPGAPFDSVSFYFARGTLSERRGSSKGTNADLEEAARMLQRHLRPGNAGDMLLLALIHGHLGQMEEATRWVSTFHDSWPTDDDAVDAIQKRIILSEIYVLLGDHEAAIDQIEQMIHGPSWMTVSLARLDPFWDPLRENPRFKKLIEG
jgi:non-specific serine/threonine protein kinase